jgi:hypothetical protein
MKSRRLLTRSKEASEHPTFARAQTTERPTPVRMGYSVGTAHFGDL